VFAVIFLGLGLIATRGSGANVIPPDLPDGLYAEFFTPRGNFICSLLYREAPLTVVNFTGLAEGTLGPEPRKPFYDGLKFHRVVPGFVVQGGDPLGDGEGDAGYEFPDEFVVGLRHDDLGILSMANSGPDTNGSQFFLTLKPVNRLNYLHSVFGRTVRGREILPLIQPDDVITRVKILRVGASARALRNDQATFDTLRAAAKPYTGSPEPGNQAHFDDPDHLLPEEPPRARYFNFQLANFERTTGLKIKARLYANFVPETPAQRPGTFTGNLARQMGFSDSGVLVTYFADIDQWGLWFGEAQLKQLMGREGNLQEYMRDGALHQTKQALIHNALAKAKTYTTEARTTLERPLVQADLIKYQVDGMLETLIIRFEPKP